MMFVTYYIICFVLVYTSLFKELNIIRVNVEQLNTVSIGLMVYNRERYFNCTYD